MVAQLYTNGFTATFGDSHEADYFALGTLMAATSRINQTDKNETSITYSRHTALPRRDGSKHLHPHRTTIFVQSTDEQVTGEIMRDMRSLAEGGVLA